MTVGNHLSYLIRAVGWRGNELARRLGCSPSLVQRWRDDRAAVPAGVIAWLQQIADAIPPTPEWRDADADRIQPGSSKAADPIALRDN